jgi:ElaB/YqjD/DUF883 family membrane-anchored ribosome-binding protein
MATAHQTYKQAANSDFGREAANTAKSVRDDMSDFASDAAKQAGDFASDVSRQAGRQFRRARNAASDIYDEAHELSVQNPHISLAVAAAFGFLLGAFLVGRR